MKLSLDALQILDAIDNKGSFAAAAESLNKVPSALTYSIRKLEDDLDVLLFDRGGRKAQLTEAGKELLCEGRSLLKAAYELECRVKRVATGWETQLNIAVDSVVPREFLWPFIQQFYREVPSTRLRIMHEVMAGAWEAMRAKTADIVIGAPSEPVPMEGVKASILGEVQWVYCVAPSHPLAKIKAPLTADQLSEHRIIAVADSSKNLPPRTVGIMEGQDTMTVPDISTKISAMIHGFGGGNLPDYLARGPIKRGELVQKEVEGKSRSAALYLLHRRRPEGKAEQWWIKTLSDSAWWQAAVERF